MVHEPSCVYCPPEDNTQAQEGQQLIQPCGHVPTEETSMAPSALTKVPSPEPLLQPPKLHSPAAQMLPGLHSLVQTRSQEQTDAAMLMSHF